MNGCNSISITDAAQDDLLAGFGFYQAQLAGLGPTFLTAYLQTLTRSSFMRVFMFTAMVFTVVLQAVSPKPFTTFFKVIRSL
ncbi:hypothetical protein [Limnohabitans sp.]|uniref:hypothetical protein n=1 Tax=Limnohabitans sp. TaxID=1907725 RepID=UPI0038BBF068